MDHDRIARELAPVLAGLGLELEAVEQQPAGRRTVLRIIVDGDGPDGTGVGLDELAEATRAVSASLDESDSTGTSPYTLEVSSRGVSRPLTAPRHWRRNVGRLVRLTRTDASEPVTGRIVSADEDTVQLDVPGGPVEIRYDEVGRALVQVEFTRSRTTPLDVDPDLADPAPDAEEEN